MLELRVEIKRWRHVIHKLRWFDSEPVSGATVDKIVAVRRLCVTRWGHGSRKRSASCNAIVCACWLGSTVHNHERI